MIKSRYLIAFFVLVILFAALYFRNTGASKTSLEDGEMKLPEPMTRMDSLVVEYDSIITARMEHAGIVGAAMAIVQNNEILLLKPYGVKEKGSRDSIDQHTLFRLASVSKTMTGALAGILSREKLIELDDKVIDYVPGIRLKDTLNTNNLSIRHLLNHTSGLVPHAYDNLVEAGVPMKVIMDSLFRVKISAPPGKLYGYQNVMFSLYDTICAVRTSGSFDEILREKLFMPFGMHQACAGFESFAANDNKALPHGKYRGNYKVLRLNDRYYDNTLPAAGINASISDMAQFLLGLTAADTSRPGNYVPNEVFEPQVESPLRWNYLRRWGDVDSKHYGLGWRIIGYKNREIAWHGGYVQGYRAEIALCREEGFGIAFLSNSPNGLASAVVPLFLDLIFDEENDDLSDR